MGFQNKEITIDRTWAQNLLKTHDLHLILIYKTITEENFQRKINIENPACCRISFFRSSQFICDDSFFLRIYFKLKN